MPRPLRTSDGEVEVGLVARTGEPPYDRMLITMGVALDRAET